VKSGRIGPQKAGKKMAVSPQIFFALSVLVLGTFIEPTTTSSVYRIGSIAHRSGSRAHRIGSGGSDAKALLLPQIIQALHLNGDHTAGKIAAGAITIEEVARNLANIISKSIGTFEVNENQLLEETYQIVSQLGIQTMENGYEWKYHGTIPRYLPFLQKLVKGNDLIIDFKYIKMLEIELHMRLGQYNLTLVSSTNGPVGSITLRSNIPGFELVKGGITFMQKGLLDCSMSFIVNSGMPWTSSLTLFSNEHIIKAQIKTPYPAYDNIKVEVARTGQSPWNIHARLTINNKSYSSQLIWDYGINGKIVLQTPIIGYETIIAELARTGVNNNNIHAKVSVDGKAYIIEAVLEGVDNVLFIIKTGHTIMGCNQFKYSCQKLGGKYVMKLEGFLLGTSYKRVFSSFDFTVNGQLVTAHWKGLVPYIAGLTSLSKTIFKSLSEALHPEVRAVFFYWYAKIDPNAEIWTLFENNDFSIEFLKSVYAKIELKFKAWLMALYTKIDPNSEIRTKFQNYGLSTELLRMVYETMQPKVMIALKALYAQIDPDSEIKKHYTNHGLSVEFLKSVYTTMEPRVTKFVMSLYAKVEPKIDSFFKALYAKLDPEVKMVLQSLYDWLLAACAMVDPNSEILAHFRNYGLSAKFITSIYLTTKTRARTFLSSCYAMIDPTFEVKKLYNRHGLSIGFYHSLYAMMVPKFEKLIWSICSKIDPNSEIRTLYQTYGMSMQFLKSLYTLIESKMETLYTNIDPNSMIKAHYVKYGISIEFWKCVYVTVKPQALKMLNQFYTIMGPKVETAFTSLYKTIQPKLQMAWRNAYRLLNPKVRVQYLLSLWYKANTTIRAQITKFWRLCETQGVQIRGEDASITVSFQLPSCLVVCMPVLNNTPYPYPYNLQTLSQPDPWNIIELYKAELWAVYKLTMPFIKSVYANMDAKLMRYYNNCMQSSEVLRTIDFEIKALYSEALKFYNNYGFPLLHTPVVPYFKALCKWMEEKAQTYFIQYIENSKIWTSYKTYGYSMDIFRSIYAVMERKTQAFVKFFYSAVKFNLLKYHNLYIQSSDVLRTIDLEIKGIYSEALEFHKNNGLPIVDMPMIPYCKALYTWIEYKVHTYFEQYIKEHYNRYVQSSKMLHTIDSEIKILYSESLEFYANNGLPIVDLPLVPYLKALCMWVERKVYTYFEQYIRSTEIWTTYKSNGFSIAFLRSLYMKIEPKIVTLYKTLCTKLQPFLIYFQQNIETSNIWTIYKKHGISMILLKSVYSTMELNIPKFLEPLYRRWQISLEQYQHHIYSSKIWKFFSTHGLSMAFVQATYAKVDPYIPKCMVCIPEAILLEVTTPYAIAKSVTASLAWKGGIQSKQLKVSTVATINEKKITHVLELKNLGAGGYIVGSKFEANILQTRIRHGVNVQVEGNQMKLKVNVFVNNKNIQHDTTIRVIGKQRFKIDSSTETTIPQLYFTQCTATYDVMFNGLKYLPTFNIAIKYTVDGALLAEFSSSLKQTRQGWEFLLYDEKVIIAKNEHASKVSISMNTAGAVSINHVFMLNAQQIGTTLNFEYVTIGQYNVKMVVINSLRWLPFTRQETTMALQHGTTFTTPTFKFAINVVTDTVPSLTIDSQLQKTSTGYSFSNDVNSPILPIVKTIKTLFVVSHTDGTFKINSLGMVNNKKITFDATILAQTGMFSINDVLTTNIPWLGFTKRTGIFEIQLGLIHRAASPVVYKLVYNVNRDDTVDIDLVSQLLQTGDGYKFSHICKKSIMSIIGIHSYKMVLALSSTGSLKTQYHFMITKAVAVNGKEVTFHGKFDSNNIITTKSFFTLSNNFPTVIGFTKYSMEMTTDPNYMELTIMKDGAMHIEAIGHYIVTGGNLNCTLHTTIYRPGGVIDDYSGITLDLRPNKYVAKVWWNDKTIMLNVNDHGTPISQLLIPPFIGKKELELILTAPFIFPSKFAIATKLQNTNVMKFAETTIILGQNALAAEVRYTPHDSFSLKVTPPAKYSHLKTDLEIQLINTMHTMHTIATAQLGSNTLMLDIGLEAGKTSIMVMLNEQISVLVIMNKGTPIQTMFAPPFIGEHTFKIMLDTPFAILNKLDTVASIAMTQTETTATMSGTFGTWNGKKFEVLVANKCTPLRSLFTDSHSTVDHTFEFMLATPFAVLKKLEAFSNIVVTPSDTTAKISAIYGEKKIQLDINDVGVSVKRLIFPPNRPTQNSRKVNILLITPFLMLPKVEVTCNVKSTQAIKVAAISSTIGAHELDTELQLVSGKMAIFVTLDGKKIEIDFTSTGTPILMLLMHPFIGEHQMEIRITTPFERFAAIDLMLAVKNTVTDRYGKVALMNKSLQSGDHTLIIELGQSIPKGLFFFKVTPRAGCPMIPKIDINIIFEANKITSTSTVGDFILNEQARLEKKQVTYKATLVHGAKTIFSYQFAIVSTADNMIFPLYAWPHKNHI
jgi:hypothetical protein